MVTLQGLPHHTSLLHFLLRSGSDEVIIALSSEGTRFGTRNEAQRVNIPVERFSVYSKTGQPVEKTYTPFN